MVSGFDMEGTTKLHRHPPEPQKRSKTEKTKRELAEEVDLLDTMLSSLVELLEEKGVVTQQEWEKRIKERVTLE